MTCPKEQALLKLFINASTSSQLLFLLLFSIAIFLVTFLTFTGRFPLIQRDQQYEYVYSDEDEEDEETREEYSCVHSSDEEERQRTHSSYSEEFISPQESFVEESEKNGSSKTLSTHNSPQVSDFENENVETFREDFRSRDVVDSVQSYAQFENSPTSSMINLNLYKSNKNYIDDGLGIIKNKKVQETSLARDERFFVYASKQLKSKKLIVDEEKDDDDDDDSTCSSSECRSSIHYRDSVTEDEFSTSSRRSCPKWESYTLFQRYDEENAFLDRINSQNKLHETESLRSIQMSPRSISERIASKFSNINKKPTDVGHNPYRELEAAYVAQICLTWEALSWNYINFRSKHASQSRYDLDIGCPATIAQLSQQFQVLLQRYVENEPYEHGRRPEIFARMRLLAPNLLLVPEYRDSDEDQMESDFHNKISSASFLKIMEGGIRTFMKFLKTDKEKSCHILAYYFRRNKRGMVDPTLLKLMKKVNQKACCKF
ncbi:myb protein X [Trifolium repens]|nr:myb protein X [Trifolium repens]